MARELQAREKEKKEVELRDLAQRARMERGAAALMSPPLLLPGSSSSVMLLNEANRTEQHVVLRCSARCCPMC